MHSKFNDIPVEADTTVLNTHEVKLGDYDAVYQRWLWDGFYGESLIFVSEEVAELADDALEALVKESQYYKSDHGVTVKRGERYAFVNFNFEAD